MEIEVGEYVRINKSRFLGIGKIIKIVGNTIYIKMYIAIPISFIDEEIKGCKHSKNIIDLVEEGDYVNGEKVIEVRNQNRKIYLMTDYVPQKYLKSEIKSIVTKEQFASVEYGLEEK